MARVFKNSVHKSTPYIICDFETTGLNMSECAATELAMIAVRGDTLEKIDEFECIFAPYQIFNPRLKKWEDPIWTAGAANVTGLTKEKCELEGEDVDELINNKIISFLEKANIFKSKTGYKPVIVAHNAQYEVKCWQNLAAGRFDLSKYFHGDVDFFGNFAPHYIDTLDLAKLLWANNSRQTSYKLSDVLERAGIPIYDAHRAMNDVRPSSQFFEYVVKLLRAAERGGVLNTLQSEGEEGESIIGQRTFKFQMP